jgi:hypothetical protein
MTVDEAIQKHGAMVVFEAALGQHAEETRTQKTRHKAGLSW